MKAVILAGGKGTRLGNISTEIPKSLLEIGDKPVLAHQIELLKKYEITDIYILVNHLKNKIQDYFNNHQYAGININYFEEPYPLGTVGGIKELEAIITEDFIVFYGDIMINMDLKRLINFHEYNRSECSLVVHPNDHPFDSDLVETNKQNKITRFHPKPHKPSDNLRNLVSAGVYIMNPAIFKYLKKGINADFGRDIFPAIYNQINMFGYNTTEYLKDMGTPTRLDEVRNDFLSGKYKRFNYENLQKAIFIDRDGVINKEKNFICKVEDMELFDFTAKAIKTINESEFLSIIVTNQSAVARNLCTIEDIEKINNKLETELGQKGAKIDSLYFCPHHPHKGFPEENKEYKIECNCRKPKTGMFLQSKEEHNIDAKKSYMIGDSERDIMFGINAGMKTIGVMTGYGLKTSNVSPDFFFRDLLQAVNFIIKDPYRKYFEYILNFINLQAKQNHPLIINMEEIQELVKAISQIT